MSILENFRSDIESFLERTGMSATAFGQQSLKDPNFMGDLKVGRAPSAKTMQRVYDFMEEAA